MPRRGAPLAKRARRVRAARGDVLRHRAAAVARAAHALVPEAPATTLALAALLDDTGRGPEAASLYDALLDDPKVRDTDHADGVLGAAAGSRGVGLAAGLALAIEFTAIARSPGGWRDDTFMCTVAFTAWSFVRLRSDATIPRGVTAGVAAAAACLTRITALSFVVPGLLWILLESRRDRKVRTSVATAALVATALIAPYLISCAVVIGDRGYDGRISDSDWGGVVAAMTVPFREGDAAAAFSAGLDALEALLAEKGFRCGEGGARNVLPDRPVEPGVDDR